MVMSHVPLKDSPTNSVKTRDAAELLESALRKELRPGFHGRVTIQVTIQDGTIQTIEEQVERKLR
jgi:hypothetical protein